MKYLFFFLFWAGFSGLMAQSFTPSNYSGIPQSAKKALYAEEFSDNSKGWQTGTFTNAVERIENGYMYLKTLKDEAIVEYQTIKIDQSKDFEISARIKFVQGNELDFVGLLWGKSADGNAYKFGFSGDGESYRISNYKSSGEWKDIAQWTDHPAVRAKNSYNEMTVRKVGSTLYFFLNTQLVHQCVFLPFYGNQVGVQAGRMSLIHVDFLRVHYIEQGSSSVPTAVTPAAAKSEAALTVRDQPSPRNKTNFQRSTFFNEDFSDNSAGWGTGATSEVSRQIKNGYYEFETFLDSYYSTYIWKEIDTQRDFEIETQIMFVSGKNNFENCILWGGDDKRSYRFGITGSGYYTIYKLAPQVVDFVDYTQSDLVKKSNYNKLTIRKLGGNYNFLLNDKLVHQTPFEPFYGNKIGFLVAKQSKMKIKSLKISYLN